MDIENYPLPAIAGIVVCGVLLVALVVWSGIRASRAETPRQLQNVRILGRVVGLPLFIVMGGLIAAFWR